MLKMLLELKKSMKHFDWVIVNEGVSVYCNEFRIFELNEFIAFYEGDHSIAHISFSKLKTLKFMRELDVVGKFKAGEKK